MKKYKDIHKTTVCIPSFETTDFQPIKFHPLSYYMLGGVDINKDLIEGNSPIFDSDEDISAGCAADALTNPKTSIFDVVENLGYEGSRDVIQNKNTSNIAPSEPSDPSEPPVAVPTVE